jgi:hypothetical protein
MGTSKNIPSNRRQSAAIPLKLRLVPQADVPEHDINLKNPASSNATQDTATCAGYDSRHGFLAIYWMRLLIAELPSGRLPRI